MHIKVHQWRDVCNISHLEFENIRLFYFVLFADFMTTLLFFNIFILKFVQGIDSSCKRQAVPYPQYFYVHVTTYVEDAK